GLWASFFILNKKSYRRMYYLTSISKKNYRAFFCPSKRKIVFGQKNSLKTDEKIILKEKDFFHK
ncbi:hypothetical protein, partial [Lactobacillus delbrueckii]|uniref:hypothetical protein n=1 Tax=Lactobacillus delbrueckii TaxID=1584 RepID=UPI0021A64076